VVVSSVIPLRPGTEEKEEEEEGRAITAHLSQQYLPGTKRGKGG